MSAALLAKRARIVALVERGDPGERDNARRALERFDAAHPELKSAPPPERFVDPFTVADAVAAAGVITFVFHFFTGSFVQRPPVKPRKVKPRTKGRAARKRTKR